MPTGAAAISINLTSMATPEAAFAVTSCNPRRGAVGCRWHQSLANPTSPDFSPRLRNGGALQAAEKPVGTVILRSPRRRRISHCLENTQSEILRFAQDDSIGGFFRSLFRRIGPPKANTTHWRDAQNRTSAKIEKGTDLPEGRWSSEVADLNDDGISRRNCFFVREIDRWGWEQCLFGTNLWRSGLSGHAQLAGFLSLRPGHVTSLPGVPRPSAHLEARPSGGGGKNNQPSQ